MSATAERLLPLYEAKMIHHYDHRWATYERDGSIRDVTEAEKQDRDFVVLPRYWVAEEEVDDRLVGRSHHQWLLGWRDICRSTDERTMIAAVIPRAGVNHKMPLVLLSDHGSVLAAMLSSLVFDYIARQKIGGTSFTYFYLRQLPLPPPKALQATAWSKTETLAEWVEARVRYLVEVSNDSPLMSVGDRDQTVWNAEIRAEVQAELDAAFVHLYGIERPDVDYILDTFPILRRKDEQAFGGYRTMRRILELFDAMADAAATGSPYRSLLPSVTDRDAPDS